MWIKHADNFLMQKKNWTKLIAQKTYGYGRVWLPLVSVMNYNGINTVRTHENDTCTLQKLKNYKKKIRIHPFDELIYFKVKDVRQYSCTIASIYLSWEEGYTTKNHVRIFYSFMRK